MKRVLVTGSQGFIGSYVCNELLQNNYHVTGVDNFSKYGPVTRAHDKNENFTLIKEKQSHVQEMKKIIKQYPKHNVILATDDDREGEGIAWHICELFDLSIKTTPRILFHEITKKKRL